MAWDRSIQQIEQLIERELSGWPEEWEGFHWPGYTYEHTLRVRNLSLSMARQQGADVTAVELAALLHDIAKPQGEPHAEAGARRAEQILSELGVDRGIRERVCHIIRTHVAPDPAYPLENLLLSDADYIDANFGYVALARFFTIRAHRGYEVAESVAGAGEWLAGGDERREKVTTQVGQGRARERLGRMRSMLARLKTDLDGPTGGGDSLAVATYIAADAHRPSLRRQVGQMAAAQDGRGPVNGLRPSPFLRHFVEVLAEEIAGER